MYEIVLDEKTGEPKRGKKLEGGYTDANMLKVRQSVATARDEWVERKTQEDRRVGAGRAATDISSLDTSNIAAGWRKNPKTGKAERIPQ